MVSIGVQINIDDNNDIKKATKAERMRIASARYNQKLIDENRCNKRHYYKKPDEFLECIKLFL